MPLDKIKIKTIARITISHASTQIKFYLSHDYRYPKLEVGRTITNRTHQQNFRANRTLCTDDHSQ